MKRNLIIINTYFQLITAINLVLNNLKNDVNDLILTDRSVDMEKKVEIIKKLNICENVIYIKSKKNCTEKNKIKKYFKYLFNRKEILTCKLENKYDSLFFFNYDLLTYAVFDELYSRNNEIVCNKYDEGYITYLNETQNNKLNKIIRTMCGKKDIDKFIKKIYLYHPQLLCYKPKCEIEKIPSLDRKEKLIEIYNKIFEYKNEFIKQKYIFFEESFFCDKKGIDDMEIILKIAEVIGKENLLVKLHPRNKIDRFEKYNIATNKTIGIPWELIQMNNDFSEKVLMTISSGSVLASRLYFNDNIKTFLLFNCTNTMSDMVNDKYLEYMDNVKDCFGMEDFSIPQNENEFLKDLREDYNGRKEK